MVASWRRVPVWLALLLGVWVAGCNVFDGSAPEPSTVDALVADARTALAAGSPARAVQLLERAFDQDSTRVRVRVELASALYAEQDLDVFALRRAAAHLVDSSGAAAGMNAADGRLGADGVCTDGAEPESSGRYVPVSLDAAPFRLWSDHASVVERARRLVVDGVFDRRASAFEEVSIGVRRKGYLVGAVTASVIGILGLDDEATSTGGTLFLDREASPSPALVACADDDSALARNHDALCALSDAAGRAVDWLQARQRLSERGGEDAVLVAPLQAVADAARARTGCS